MLVDRSQFLKAFRDYTLVLLAQAFYTQAHPIAGL